ncbi:MAG: TRAP transporter substrate-binding protein [Burkholderiaceae bacterium]|nr:TRAP transporter substrate-binding protein [Burkholderiaceae bacterium]
MDRRSLIKNAGIAGVLAAGVAPAVHAQPTIRWRLASSFPKALDTIFGGAEQFAKNVSDMTGGKFQISVHAGGELMPAFGVVDGVQQGTVEAAHTAPYYFFGKSPAFALGCAIPFGLNSRQTTAWMFEGNGGKLMNEFYSKYNMVAFPAGNTGAQMGGWYRKEIKSMADMQGLKMRIGGFGGTIVGKIGGVPQSIPGGEIYQALEKGTIDAAEWVGPYDDQKLGFNKVAPFYHYPGWWEGGPELDVMINKDAFAKLSTEYKNIVRMAATQAHVTMQAMYDVRNPKALKELLASGTKLIQMPKDVMDAAFKAAQESYEELSDTDADWKKIYADFKQFRRDQNQWARLTEGTFDRYMQQAKL